MGGGVPAVWLCVVQVYRRSTRRAGRNPPSIKNETRSRRKTGGRCTALLLIILNNNVLLGSDQGKKAERGSGGGSSALSCI